MTAILRDHLEHALANESPSSAAAIEAALEAALDDVRALDATAKPARRRAERPQVENADYIAFANRILASMGKRAAADIDSLIELARLRDQVDAQLDRAILACREDYSLAEIGSRLGVSKQAVDQRIRRATAAPIEAIA